jgi:Protein of unknown function (DUF2478)
MVSEFRNAALAAIQYQRGSDIDELLSRSCAQLRLVGVRIGGVLQQSSGQQGQCASSVHVVDLRSGLAESLGRGLLGCISAAIEAGVAVLTAVRPPYDQAWYAFHGGCAHELAPDLQDIIDWALASTARSTAHLSQGETASIQDGTKD